MDHRNLKKSVLIVECSIKLLCCCTDLPSPKGCVRPSVDDAKYSSVKHGYSCHHGKPGKTGDKEMARIEDPSSYSTPHM